MPCILERRPLHLKLALTYEISVVRGIKVTAYAFDGNLSEILFENKCDGLKVRACGFRL